MGNTILTVSKVEKLTKDSKAFYFEHNSALGPALAGQFLTLITTQNDKEYRRSYSIFTPAGEGLAVGVKRVPGGIVSNYLNTYIKVGSKIEVQGPAGQFCFDPSFKQPEHLLLIAGGSGVTPMMSILKTVLTQCVNTRVSMLFVNKSQADIMFANELKTIEQEYPERFSLIHYLDAENVRIEHVKKKGILGVFGAKEQVVTPGFITPEKINRIFSQFAITKDVHAYICGPSGFMTMAETALQAMELPKAHIKKENFVPSVEVRPKPDFEPTPCTAFIAIDNETHEFDIPSGKSVLQAAVEANINIPFSCREGTCTSCYGKCSSGELGMLNDEALTDEEIAEGGFLPCVAYPKSKKLIINMNAD